jgi:hypothetical protein
MTTLTAAAFDRWMANTMSTRNTGALVIATVLVWLVAAVVTAVAGPERLSRTWPRQVEAG